MCMILGDEPVRVSGTSIFARHSRPGHQVLVYSMRVATRTSAAMILPLPVPRGTAEDAVTFLDLSDYPEFFDNMNEACQPEPSRDLLTMSLGMAEAAGSPPLEVHEVGDFEASFVPRRSDLNRLDPRFQVPPRVWQRLPYDSEWGYAVFQLRLDAREAAEGEGQKVHPMAFEFPTRESAKLFYPTVHVHDRSWHDRAGFDHALYCQRPDAKEAFRLGWERLLVELSTPSPPAAISLESIGFGFRRSDGPALYSMATGKTAGTVDPQARLFAMDVVGEFPNRDIWVG